MDANDFLDCNCKKGCCAGLSEKTISKIREAYKGLSSIEAGDMFLASCMENEDVKIRRANRVSDARQKSTTYSIEVKGVLHKVCRVAFALIYGITQKKITIIRNKKEANSLEFRKGKNRNKSFSNPKNEPDVKIEEASNTSNNENELKIDSTSMIIQEDHIKAETTQECLSSLNNKEGKINHENDYSKIENINNSEKDELNIGPLVIDETKISRRKKKRNKITDNCNKKNLTNEDMDSVLNSSIHLKNIEKHSLNTLTDKMIKSPKKKKNESLSNLIDGTNKKKKSADDKMLGKDVSNQNSFTHGPSISKTKITKEGKINHENDYSKIENIKYSEEDELNIGPLVIDEIKINRRKKKTPKRNHNSDKKNLTDEVMDSVLNSSPHLKEKDSLNNVTDKMIKSPKKKNSESLSNLIDGTNKKNKSADDRMIGKDVKEDLTTQGGIKSKKQNKVDGAKALESNEPERTSEDKDGTSQKSKDNNEHEIASSPIKHKKKNKNKPDKNNILMTPQKAKNKVALESEEVNGTSCLSEIKKHERKNERGQNETLREIKISSDFEKLSPKKQKKKNKLKPVEESALDVNITKPSKKDQKRDKNKIKDLEEDVISRSKNLSFKIKKHKRKNEVSETKSAQEYKINSDNEILTPKKRKKKFLY